MLEEAGVERIYSPDDGRQLGLQGLVDDMLRRADFPTGELNGFELSDLDGAKPELIARLISAAENHPEKYSEVFEAISERAAGSKAPIVGLPLPPLRVAGVLAAFVGLAAPIRAQIAFYGNDHLYPLDECRALGWQPRPYAESFTDAFGARSA